jgi:hypothetical protein
MPLADFCQTVRLFLVQRRQDFSNRRVKPMKKMIIAALASLMLAGAISAATGENPDPTTRAVVIVGEGGSPIPIAPPSNLANDARSNN